MNQTYPGKEEMARQFLSEFEEYKDTKLIGDFTLRGPKIARLTGVMNRSKAEQIIELIMKWDDVL